ncbi:hypothetical protein RND81_08G214000 [Saponaria officinalis]|uniref:DUF674 domain-containing protein n=1 Tax=Saponaria officinalis TaxID=3572 RepID=A0AAW1JAW8_SAPOF
MAETKVSLKLLIDTQAKKVLFAEAGKQFVDFLFHIMSLPVGTVVKLLNVKNMVGSLGSLYSSINMLNTDYFQTNVSKNAVLHPKSAVNVPLLSLEHSAANCAEKTKVYRRSRYNNHFGHITDCQGTPCPSCGGSMNIEVSWVKAPSSAGVASTNVGTDGYVKGVVTYMVMDNLEVKPMSTISGITLINKFHVKDVSCLVEKEVEVGLKEGIAMLKASLETKAVLTTVFMGK